MSTGGPKAVPRPWPLLERDWDGLERHRSMSGWLIQRCCMCHSQTQDYYDDDDDEEEEEGLMVMVLVLVLVLLVVVVMVMTS